MEKIRKGDVDFQEGGTARWYKPEKFSVTVDEKIVDMLNDTEMRDFDKVATYELVYNQAVNEGIALNSTESGDKEKIEALFKGSQLLVMKDKYPSAMYSEAAAILDGNGINGLNPEGNLEYGEKIPLGQTFQEERDGVIYDVSIDINGNRYETDALTGVTYYTGAEDGR